MQFLNDVMQGAPNEVNVLIWLLFINLGTLISIITIGYKITRIFNRMEFKVDLLWNDYERRKRIGLD